jgi:hypothetical protein
MRIDGRILSTITTPTATLVATISRKGAFQPQRLDRYSPSGMPATWLVAKAVCTNAHDPSAQPVFKQVGGDGEHDRADDAAEHARDHARKQQEVVGVARQRAQQGSEHEADVEEQQQLLAIEAVGESGRQQSRQAGAEGIGGDQQAELRRSDPQCRDDQCAQRREDHEIQDDRELQKRDQRDDELLIGRVSPAASAPVAAAARSPADVRDGAPQNLQHAPLLLDRGVQLFVAAPP